MAEYIPLDHMRQLEKPMEEWTSPTGQPAATPSGLNRLRRFRASMASGVSPRSIQLTAILLCLAIWAGTFYAIWRL